MKATRNSNDGRSMTTLRTTSVRWMVRNLSHLRNLHEFSKIKEMENIAFEFVFCKIVRDF